MTLNLFLKHLLGLGLVRRIGTINIRYLCFRGRNGDGEHRIEEPRPDMLQVIL